MIDDLCFEIIQRCPNNCMFCSSNSNYSKTNIIELKKFKEVIDHFINLGGINEISISGGEPLLHPDLDEMIKYCSEKNIFVTLFTSGVKERIKLSEEEIAKYENHLEERYYNLKIELPAAKYDSLIKKEVNKLRDINSKTFDSIKVSELKKLESLGLKKIVFDVQAWELDLYNEIMGTDSLWEHEYMSILNATQTNLITDAHFIPTKINYNDFVNIVEMLDMINFNNISILNFVPQGRGRNNRELLELNEEEFIEFTHIYKDIIDKNKIDVRVGIPLSVDDSHACTAGYKKLVVKYDGSILPCPAFKELDRATCENLGIEYININKNLEDFKLRNTTYRKPLCKIYYRNNNHIN